MLTTTDSTHATTRRIARPPRSVRRSPFAGSLAATLALTLALAACGGDTAAPELTDPTEILTAAATTTAAATSVHIDLRADGELSLDLLGTGAAAPVQLTGSTANADVDIEGGDARVTFALPGVLGLRGELIAVDGTGYLKTSLTGPTYRTIALGGAAPTDPAASPDTASMLDALTEFLARPELEPVKGEDVECGGTTCYAVSIELTADELAALAAEGGIEQLPTDLPIPIPDLGAVNLGLTILVEKDTTRLAGLTVAVTTGEAGQATIETTFSKWDDSVSISAPPADQVGAG